MNLHASYSLEFKEQAQNGAYLSAKFKRKVSVLSLC